MKDETQVTDSVEVKGPGPEWADRDAEETDRPLEIGEVRREGLEESTVEELRNMARQYEVSGRSDMSGNELRKALYDYGVGVVKGPGPEWE